MFFFIFYGLWTSVTFDASIRGDPSKKFWKENHSNFHMISITQNINFAPCDGFSQITSHIIMLSFYALSLICFIIHAWPLLLYLRLILWNGQHNTVTSPSTSLDDQLYFIDHWKKFLKRVGFENFKKKKKMENGLVKRVG